MSSVPVPRTWYRNCRRWQARRGGCPPAARAPGGWPAPAKTPAIRAVQRWLPDHLGEDLGVATLARRTGMGERTFARAFRAETGVTPAAFIEDLRVEAARRLLESTELTVGAIARQIG